MSYLIRLISHQWFGLFLLGILLTSGFPSSIAAQNWQRSTWNAAGASAGDGSSEISYTLGQLVVTSQQNSGLALQLGFHQGYALVVDTEEQTAEAAFKVFPNPTQDFVQVTGFGAQNWQWTLINYQGQTLDHGQHTTGVPTLELSLTGQPAGIYYLQVFPEANNAAPLFFTLIKI